MSTNVRAYAPPAPPSDRHPEPASRPAAAPGLPAAPTVGYEPIKTVLDLGLGAVLLIPALPVILLAAVVVRLTSPGPAFYTQTRVGRGGRGFRIIKLRTMHHDCEKVSGVRWSAPGDARVTWVGRFLRATHLDELPQLFNVLRGEMSLVGPRPERPEITPALEKLIPDYRARLRVRPGVTGLAQVRLPADTCVHGVRRKLAYDLYYIREMGVWLDLRLIACTGLKMLGVPLRGVLRVCRIPGDRTVGLPDEVRGAVTMTAVAGNAPADRASRPARRDHT